LPDALLERGAAYIEGQLQADRGGFDKAHDLGDPRFVVCVASDQRGARKLVL